MGKKLEMAVAVDLPYVNRSPSFVQGLAISSQYFLDLSYAVK
jgi:hypothetical protein